MGLFSDMLFQMFQQKGPIFYSVLLFSGLLLIGGELALFRRSRRALRDVPALLKTPADDLRFHIFWSIAPALVLFLLLFVHTERKSGPVTQRPPVPEVQLTSAGSASPGVYLGLPRAQGDVRLIANP